MTRMRTGEKAKGKTDREREAEQGARPAKHTHLGILQSEERGQQNTLTLEFCALTKTGPQAILNFWRVTHSHSTHKICKPIKLQLWVFSKVFLCEIQGLTYENKVVSVYPCFLLSVVNKTIKRKGECTATSHTQRQTLHRSAPCISTRCPSS